MRYYPRLNMYKSSNFKLDLTTMNAYSYRWYLLGMQSKLGYIVNDYAYSNSTVKHISKLRRLLNELNIDYITLAAPRGLQNIGASIEYYLYEINTLERAIAKKGTRKTKNEERRKLINQHKSKLVLLKQLEVNNSL